MFSLQRQAVSDVVTFLVAVKTFTFLTWRQWLPLRILGGVIGHETEALYGWKEDTKTGCW